VYNAKARATGGSMSAKSVAAADLEDSLMTMSAADMLNVQLKILGDPQFLKQDDCFYSPAALTAGVSSDPRLTPNGSLRTDYSEIYVLLTFRTPIDLDENTGLMNFGPNYKTSVFSGLYRVLTVTSELSKGQFTQTLNLIRLPNQSAYDYANQLQEDNAQRQNDMIPSLLTTQTVNPVIVQEVPTPSILISSPESIDLQSAQQQLAGTTDVPSVVSQAQQNLINLNNNIQATPITAQTRALLGL
jgi:hypothetical protein